MPTEGQRLKALADQLKREKKTSRKEIADKMGITKEHLSAVFNKDKLTPEIKERAIKGLHLPPDFFDESPPAAHRSRGTDRQIRKHRICSFIGAGGSLQNNV